MKSRLGIKLWLSYLIVIIIILAVVGSLLNPLFSSYLIEERKNQLLHQAAELVNVTQKFNSGDMSDDYFLRMTETMDRYTDTRFVIIDRLGVIIALSRDPTGSDRRTSRINRGFRLFQEDIEQKVLKGETVVKENISRFINTPIITVALPVRSPNSEGVDEVSGAVITYAPVHLVTSIVKKMYYYLGISSVIAMMLAAVIAYYYSRKISQPLKNMNEAALAMAGGDYGVKIVPSSHDEVGQLAGSLNFLAKELDNNVAALEEEKGKLESIVLSVNEGLVAVDMEGRIILVNPVMENMFMAPMSKIIGQTLQEAAQLPDLIKSFREVLEKQEPIATSFKVMHSTYRTAVSPIRTENGIYLGAVGIMQDISEMEKVEQMRRDFIANVSHELRAPITVIRGYADCLLDKVADNPSEYYYGIIRKETMRLERLIEDIMDLSLLQSGKTKLELEDVNLSQLVQETVNRFQNRTNSQGVKLISHIDAPDIIVYCDSDRMEQLLVILLDNAIKYTPSGGTISVSLGKVETDTELRVQDSGMGISQEDLPYIWDRFYKGDKARSRQEGNGTGLGLFIARQIAQLHQAEITVESISGEGSTFILKLKK